MTIAWNSQHFRESWEAAPIATFLMDPRGQIVWANAAFCKLLGYSASQLEGRHFLELASADRPEGNANFQRRMERLEVGGTVEGQCCFRRCNGSTIWMELSARAIYDQEGFIKEFVSQAFNITRNNEAQAERCEPEPSDEAAQEITRTGSWSWEISTNQVAWSDQLYRIFGLRPQEFGATFEAYLERVHPEDRPKTRTLIERALQERQSFDSYERIVRPDGSTRILHSCGTTAVGSDGQVVRMVGICQDVTEAKEAEARLRASEERYRELFENANDIIYTIDLAGNFTSVNRAAERTCGYSREEALRMNYTHVVAPEYVDLARRMIQEKLKGAKCSNYEIEIVTKHGRRTPLELSTRLIFRDGHPVGIQGIGRDITERKQNEQTLRELSGRLLRVQDEERRKIARDLHDSMGQSMGALALNLGVVREEENKLGPAARRSLQESFEILERSSAEIRTMSHLLHPPMLDEDGLESALPWLTEGFAKRSGIRVQLMIPKDLGRLPLEIEQTLFRIAQESLANVHRHSGSAAAQVRLLRIGDAILLEVSDQGQGMPPGALERSRRGLSNLGVGILGMRERVKQVGGTLEIDSGAWGTTVRATLPLSEEPR